MREKGFYWVLWWANPPEDAEAAYWNGDAWELTGEAHESGDDGLAWIGERLTPPTIDIAKLHPRGEG